MSVLRLPREHSIDRFSRQFIEAAQSVGEMCIVFQMYHANTDKGHPRCSNCFDDVYEQSESPTDCPYCFGTTFEGGVKNLWRVWAIFTDSQQVEQETKRGLWDPDDRQVQLEAYPDLQEHDYLIRVKKWGEDFIPLETAQYYRMGPVTEVTLRTGAHYGQQNLDKIGQKAAVSVVASNDAIRQYTIPPDIVPRPPRPVL